MIRGLAAITPVVAALALAAPAVGDSSMSVTATGTAQVKVTPKNRNSEASIEAAVEKAHKAGISGAIGDAREYALEYAQAAGLTLGSVTAVSDLNENGPYGPFSFYGPFGPNQYCGTTQQPVFKTVAGKRKLKGFKRVHKCFAPAFQDVTLTVTYSAS